MKIGIIGNMNNMYFSLARYLIDEGYDCELLIFDFEPEHFHPSSDTFTTKYEPYIRQLSWGDPAGFLRNKQKVKEDLSRYDFLIGNGSAPAFVTSIGRKLDIFIPYGDDLYSYPFVKMVHPSRFIPYLLLSYYQRRGIQDAPYIIFDQTNTAFEKIIAKLAIRGKRIACPPPLLYHKEYQCLAAGKSKDHPFGSLLQQLRSENDLLVMQYVRQFWKGKSKNWNLKGNDVLMKGYARFLQSNPGARAKLILFEYGKHVPDTKELIRTLGIESHIIWLPKMPRKYLMSFIQISDVVVGELFHSWLTYCVVLETISMAKPLMQKRIDSEFINTYPELYPMLHATTPEEVCKGLEKVLNNKEETKQLGEKAREWFLQYCVEKPLAEIKRIIKEKEVDA